MKNSLRSYACFLGAGAMLIAAGASARAAAKPITLIQADAPVIKKAIAAKRGHVVLVNFWATYCPPCVAEFPSLVRLQKEFRKQGLIVMAVSADSRHDIDTKVKPFLAAKHADFPQFLTLTADPEKFINAFDKTWQGELPRTLIYDKRGRLVKTLNSEQTYAQLQAAVKPFLK